MSRWPHEEPIYEGPAINLAKAIKVTAALREMQIRELVIAALEAYLAAGEGKVK